MCGCVSLNMLFVFYIHFFFLVILLCYGLCVLKCVIVGVNAVSCHCVALDVEGRCYTWGRNEV